MSDPLPVDVSRSELHAVETPESYEATGPFTVAITNHGRDAHVHLKLDDDLAGVASLEGDGNYYVERDDTREVRVDATPRDEPVSGGLIVETGYGAESVAVEVTVSAPRDEGIAVDEELGKPAADDATPAQDRGGSGTESMPDGALPVAALAVIAIAIAGLVAVSVGSPVVVGGVVVVLVAVLVAVWILVR